MPDLENKTSLIEAHSIGYIFDGATVSIFSNIDVSLGSRLQFLVGQNGIGKSLLGAILARRIEPTTGDVRHFASVGYLPQHLEHFGGTVAGVLGVDSLLSALHRVLNGEGGLEDHGVLDGHWNIEEELEELLHSIGLSSSVLGRPFETLSGGERTRLCLGALKRKGHDFLILDEPSNHLDREGRKWLLTWLSGMKGALVISHDRLLLRSTDEILELSGNGLKRFRGGLDSYRAARQQLRMSAEKQHEKARKQLREARRALQTSIEQTQRRKTRGRTAAAESNQSNVVLGSNKGRSEHTQARLSRLHSERIRSKLSEWHAAKEEMEIVDALSFDVTIPGRSANTILVSLRNAVLPFGSKKPVWLDIAAHERVAITGSNGCGKSTLLKVLMGRLSLLEGSCEVTDSVSLLDQHLSLLDPHSSALANFMALAPGWEESIYRTILAHLRLRRESALHSVQSLSGGERLKIALACLFSGPCSPGLLLLDEPENHLDMESRDLLKGALVNYRGGLVIVSHDDEFIADIGTQRELRMN
jgi:ATPase subunit of ABC transporter with duplicated ATPase domains